MIRHPLTTHCDALSTVRKLIKWEESAFALVPFDKYNSFARLHSIHYKGYPFFILLILSVPPVGFYAGKLKVGIICSIRLCFCSKQSKGNRQDLMFYGSLASQ